jgi:hypothetical protein
MFGFGVGIAFPLFDGAPCARPLRASSASASCRKGLYRPVSGPFTARRKAQEITMANYDADSRVRLAMGRSTTLYAGEFLSHQEYVEEDSRISPCLMSVNF